MYASPAREPRQLAWPGLRRVCRVDPRSSRLILIIVMLVMIVVVVISAISGAF